MQFLAKGTALTRRGMNNACRVLGIGEPEVWAVLNVETRGFGFLPDRRPQILFERHIFSRLTSRRFDAGHPDLSSASPGGYAGGGAEYARLQKAMTLDRNAALAAASWGIGQVMGFNHKAAGHATVGAMVKAMVKDEDAQLLAMMSFIKNNGLHSPLARHDWAAFARGYNGPDFRKNDYDHRLQAAHAKFEALLPDLELRTAQAALTYLGFSPGPIDGLQGRLTRSALLAFQQQRGLPVTGELDRTTRSRLLADAWPRRRT